METYPREPEAAKVRDRTPKELEECVVRVNPSSFSVSGDQLVALRTSGISCDIDKCIVAKSYRKESLTTFRQKNAYEILENIIIIVCIRLFDY